MKSSPIQTKILRWTLRASFLLPLVYWFYLGLSGGLGAQPIVTVNRQTGYVVLSLLIANLWLGVFIHNKWLGPRGLRWIFSERRSLGIATGVYAVLHFSSYLGKEAFETKAFLQIATKLYLTLGFTAFCMVMIMTLTSNDFSVKKLGFKRWKNLHRGLHLVSVFILGHIFLIEKGNLPLMALLTFPLIPFQVYRLIQFLTPAKGVRRE
jgi:sulfoxide reductase heme-binding subunit YedZ